jgi:glycerophosphoryl diester phosphodiesterase
VSLADNQCPQLTAAIPDLPASFGFILAHMLLIIGHRGASGYRPEHTLASYQLAIEQGADFIEPDLVSTKDHVLVARHENEISGTTDVAGHPEFAERRVTKLIDGSAVTGWFTEDFTLAELKTLRARERLPELRPGNVAYDTKFEIPTFDEIIRLARNAARPIGLYPETKHPSYFASLGLPLDDLLVATLDRNGYRDASAPVFVQSFETANLKHLRHRTALSLIQLIDATGRPFDLKASSDARTYADLLTRAGLAEVATYASGIGVHKELVIPRDSQARSTAPTRLIDDARRAGLAVHAWTFRAENHFLPLEYRVGDPASPSYPRAHGDLAAEIERFRLLGVDGVFTDFPDVGRRVAG